VNAWVKRGILLGFRVGKLTDHSILGVVGTGIFGRILQMTFIDKDTYPGAEVYAGGWRADCAGRQSVRSGAYVARGVVMMPPAYINAGAYIDEGTMVDSHALVGSCAQIGKRVHLSAAAQIGGVLEPVNASPGDHRGRCAGGRNTGRV
jgi:2,3,4,5-tetrahydropyridine-2-carboxylate N-succinyltransferase